MNVCIELHQYTNSVYYVHENWEKKTSSYIYMIPTIHTNLKIGTNKHQHSKNKLDVLQKYKQEKRLSSIPSFLVPSRVDGHMMILLLKLDMLHGICQGSLQHPAMEKNGKTNIKHYAFETSICKLTDSYSI